MEIKVGMWLYGNSTDVGFGGGSSAGVDVGDGDED